MANIIGTGTGDPLWGSVRFLYPLTSNLSDVGPNKYSDATANGTGAIATQAGIPGGAGYFNNQTVNDSNRLEFPNAAIPDEGAGDWTFEFQIYDEDWIFDITKNAELAFIGDNTFDTSKIEFRVEPKLLDPGAGTNYDMWFKGQASTGSSFFPSFNYSFIEGPASRHVAVCRNGGNLFYYVDGVLRFTQVVGAAEFNFNGANGVYSIFGKNGVSIAVASGHINNVRWTSAARYDGTNFTPPDESFATDGCVVLREAIPDRVAHVNTAFSLDVSYYFQAPSGLAITYTATGLPSGLTMATNGVISGTITDSGLEGMTFTVTATATNSCGSLNDTFDIDVAVTVAAGGESVCFQHSSS